MNHCVPGFEMGGDYAAPHPINSGFARPKKPSAGEEDIMELLWQNGQVVVQTQNQKPTKKTTFGAGELAIQVEKEIRQSGEEQQHLFMQEYEMASWLQYPLDDSSFDRDLYADFLYAAPTPPAPVSTITQPRAVAEIRPPSASPRPPIPPPSTKPDNSPRLQNFVHFSRLPSRPRTEPMNKPSVTTARESTVVESNETPTADPGSRISHSAADSRHMVIMESGTATATARTTAVSGDMATGTRDVTVSSSPGGSGASFIASEEARKPQLRPPPAPENRKRKAREADDNECQSEDIEFEAMKQARGSTSTKRSRAAEVHNLSERRRRDRINEKMRALQELIPRCNKSDKASMLDEAIEYLKSLQLQVQMMSMGCGMIPMMYPGMQQYMPAMGLGMGMGMSMDMGMNRSMIPYPTMLPDSGMANPGAAAHMGTRFPIPAFHMPPMPGPDPSRVQASNHTDPALNPAISHNHNQHRMPNFIDPYQQFLSLHQAQLPLPQNQGATQPAGSNKPISSKDIITPDNQQRPG